MYLTNIETEKGSPTLTFKTTFKKGWEDILNFIEVFLYDCSEIEFFSVGSKECTENVKKKIHCIRTCSEINEESSYIKVVANNTALGNRSVCCMLWNQTDVLKLISPYRLDLKIFQKGEHNDEYKNLIRAFTNYLASVDINSYILYEFNKKEQFRKRIYGIIGDHFHGFGYILEKGNRKYIKLVEALGQYVRGKYWEKAQKGFLEYDQADPDSDYIFPCLDESQNHQMKEFLQEIRLGKREPEDLIAFMDLIVGDYDFREALKRLKK